ncbi:hypothetical protein [Rubritalea tangerina]|uniref:hypothetical protein n=1 Tax=Rubritalea tangerina TaxID=430798 RepID=UPI003607096E
MTFCKIIRFTLKSRSANFTRLNPTPCVYSESGDGIIPLRDQKESNDGAICSDKDAKSPARHLLAGDLDACGAPQHLALT